MLVNGLFISFLGILDPDYNKHGFAHIVFEVVADWNLYKLFAFWVHVIVYSFSFLSSADFFFLRF